MRTGLFAAAALLAVASGASASLVQGTDAGWYTGLSRNGGGVLTPANPNTSLRATANAYVNWAAPQGTGVLQGLNTTGLNRLDGDDTTLVPNGVNLLSDFGFSFANTNPAGSTARITAFTGDILFFDGTTLAQVGGLNGIGGNLAGLAGGGLAAQSSVRLNFGAGSLESAGIFLPTNLLTVMRITSVTFGAGTGNDPNLIGQQVRNPVSTGSSTDELIVNGTITPSPFGGNPPGNYSYLIVTNSIPTPGATALLGLGGIVALRRRRA